MQANSLHSVFTNLGTGTAWRVLGRGGFEKRQKENKMWAGGGEEEEQQASHWQDPMPTRASSGGFAQQGPPTCPGRGCPQGPREMEGHHWRRPGSRLGHMPGHSPCLSGARFPGGVSWCGPYSQGPQTRLARAECQTRQKGRESPPPTAFPWGAFRTPLLFGASSAGTGGQSLRGGGTGVRGGEKLHEETMHVGGQGPVCQSKPGRVGPLL